MGYQEPWKPQTCVTWAVENDALPAPVDVDEVMTREYLPEAGQGRLP